MKILPLIAALLFTPVAFSQLSMGGNVVVGMPGPAGPAGTNGTNGTNGVPGPNCSVSSPPGTCDLGSNTLLAGGVATTASVVGPIINGVYQVDGTTYASVQAAVAACLASSNVGCVIDARASGRLGSAADVIGSFDPVRTCSGSVPNQTCAHIPLTLLLGPYSDYTAGTITLESGLTIQGSGVATIITSSSVTNDPILQLSPNNSFNAQSVTIKEVEFVGAVSNTTQRGANLDCTTTTNAGMWNSNWTGVRFDNFMGDSVRFACSPNSGVSAIQFNTFTNLRVRRPAGGGYGMYIAGSVGNDQWIGGQVSSTSLCDTTGTPTDVYIGDNGGTFNPYSLAFEGFTIQGASQLVQFHGANNITFNSPHHEGCSGTTNGYQFVSGGSGNYGITINNPYFAGIGNTAGSLFDTSAAGTALQGVRVNNATCGSPALVFNGTVGPTHGQDFRITGSNCQTNATSHLLPQAIGSNGITNTVLTLIGGNAENVANYSGPITQIVGGSRFTPMPGETYIVHAQNGGWSLNTSAPSGSITQVVCSGTVPVSCVATAKNNYAAYTSGGYTNVGFIGATLAFTVGGTQPCSPLNGTTGALTASDGATFTFTTTALAAGTFVCSPSGTADVVTNLSLRQQPSVYMSQGDSASFMYNDATTKWDLITLAQSIPATQSGTQQTSTALHNGYQGNTVWRGVVTTLPGTSSGAICDQFAIWTGSFNVAGAPTFTGMEICQSLNNNGGTLLSPVTEWAAKSDSTITPATDTSPSVFNGDWVTTSPLQCGYTGSTASCALSRFSLAGSQDLTGVQGATGTKPFACTGTFTPGNFVSSDANGNCVDSGVSSTGALSHVVSSFCTGTATSSATLSLIGMGGSATACTGAAVNGSAFQLPIAGTIANLTVSCSTTGVNASSGVFTIFAAGDTVAPNSGTTTGVTVTYGTTTAETAVVDSTHTFAVAAKTKLQVRFTTQATETLGNCKVSFTY